MALIAQNAKKLTIYPMLQRCLVSTKQLEEDSKLGLSTDKVPSIELIDYRQRVWPTLIGFHAKPDFVYRGLRTDFA